MFRVRVLGYDVGGLVYGGGVVVMVWSVVNGEGGGDGVEIGVANGKAGCWAEKEDEEEGGDGGGEHGWRMYDWMNVLLGMLTVGIDFYDLALEMMLYGGVLTFCHCSCSAK